MTRRVVGACTLAALIATLGPAIAAIPGIEALAARLFDHLGARADDVSVAFDGPSGLLVGDPVLRPDGDVLVLVGRVRSVVATKHGETAILAVDPQALRMTQGVRATAMHPGSNLGWTLKTLTPPPLRDRVAAELGAVFDREGKAIWQEAAPALREGAGAVLRAIGDALPDVLEAERPRWAPVVERLEREVFEAELRPALDAELWPRIEREARTTGADAAQEILREFGVAALGRAAWAAAKDAAHVGDEKALQKELEKLIDDKAAPVLKRRAPEFAAALARAVRDAWAQPSVREALDRALLKASEDAEARAVAMRIIRAVVVDRPEVAARLRAIADDPRLAAAAAKLSHATEPVFEAALRDMLLRSDRKGLDLRLTMVLRNVLLWKDRRYVLWEEDPAGGVPGSATLAGRRSG